MADKGVPLARAAAELKRGYWATRDAVLRGDLRGWQDARGRWLVDELSLQKAKERLAAAGADGATP